MLLFLGVRTGLVVASLVPAMVMALFVMGALGIGLDQMSLAALIIALGMLVDNAILTTESIMVQMAGGRRPIEAAVASAREPWPMPCAARRWTCRTGRRGRSGEKIVLRTIRQAYRGAEFEDLVPWTWADGSRPRLGDVATVVDGFEETDQYARFDVEPTMLVSEFRTGDQSAIEIATLASEYVAEAEARLPEGHLADRLAERRRVAEHPASLMLRSGFAGFALVLLVLALFLELRLAFWVSLGPRSRSWAPSRCTSGLGRLRQRALAVRLRPRARNRRRRRDHRRREHLPAP